MSPRERPLHPPAPPEGGPSVPPARSPCLDVFVASHCPNCGEARRLAGEVAARFPDALVHVIDLDHRGGSVPEAVVAVPTYLLDGEVISLGNPAPEELFSRMAQSVGEGP